MSVLSHQRYRGFLVSTVDERQHAFPGILEVGIDAFRIHISLDGREIKSSGEQLVEALLDHQQRHVKDIGHIMDRKHILLGDVTKQRDLLTSSLIYRAPRPADDKVGHETQGPKLLDAVLRGLGLLLLSVARHRDHGHVDQTEVLWLDPQLQLPQRLDERHGLDVADRA